MPAPASIPVGAAAPNDGGWGSISSKGRQYAEPWHGVLDVTSWPWANRSGWQPRSQPCTRRWVLFPRLRSVPWLGMGCGELHRAMPYIHCGSICAFAIKMIIANILKSRCTNSPLPNGVGFKPKQFLEGSGGNLFKARAILEKKKKRKINAYSVCCTGSQHLNLAASRGGAQTPHVPLVLTLPQELPQHPYTEPRSSTGDAGEQQSDPIRPSSLGSGWSHMARNSVRCAGSVADRQSSAGTAAMPGQCGEMPAFSPV